MIEVGFGSPSDEPPGGSDMQDNISEGLPCGCEDALVGATAAATGAAAAACVPVSAAGPGGLPGAAWFAVFALAPPVAGAALFSENDEQSMEAFAPGGAEAVAVTPSDEGFGNEAASREAFSSDAPIGAPSAAASGA